MCFSFDALRIILNRTLKFLVYELVITNETFDMTDAGVSNKNKSTSQIW